MDTGTSCRDSSSTSTACSLAPESAPVMRCPLLLSAMYSKTGIRGCMIRQRPRGRPRGRWLLLDCALLLRLQQLIDLGEQVWLQLHPILLLGVVPGDDLARAVHDKLREVPLGVAADWRGLGRELLIERVLDRALDADLLDHREGL